jgi:hypothetical protein
LSESRLRGRAALHSSRLTEARALLEAALREDPADTQARRDLAWTYYRLNDFPRAAKVFEGLPNAEAMTAKLASFAGDYPYEVTGPVNGEVPFLLTDPLPVVQIEVEGRAVCAAIDTAGAELILDAELAGEVGARLFGSQEGTFAGGRRARYAHGRVERVRMGEFEVRGVPVHILPTRRFSAITGGRYRIDGVIGTNLLAQFRPTLDYPGGRLVLERPEVELRPSGVKLPFDMLGDHYLISDQGWLNGVGPLRFFVDSGLAGGAFTCPPETLHRAGIAIPATRDRGGVGGGGGAVATGLFTIDELGLGTLRQQNLTGIYIEPSADATERDESWDGLISHGFLRNYRWTIDFIGSAFIFA